MKGKKMKVEKALFKGKGLSLVARYYSESPLLFRTHRWRSLDAIALTATMALIPRYFTLFDFVRSPFFPVGQTSSCTVARIGIGKARAIEAFMQAQADPLHGYMCATQE